MSRKPARSRRRHLVEQLECRRFLTVTWVAASDGTWSTPGNWNPARVPLATDDVVINQPGGIHITIPSGAVASSVALTGDVLEVAGGTLAVGGAVNNSGSILVDPAAQITVGGVYTGAAGSSLTMPGGGQSTDPTSNRLTNAGFEAPAVGTNTTLHPANWANWGSSYASNQFAYGGAQSLATSGPNSGVLQNFSVTPNTSYTLSAYGMVPTSSPLTGSESGFMQLIFLDSGGNQISPYAPPNAITVLSSSSSTGGPLAGTIGSSGWNHFSMTVTAPANAATVNAVVEAGAFGSAGTGTVYWDGLQFGPAVLGPSHVTAGSIANNGTITIGPANVVTTTGTFSQTTAGTLNTQIGGAPSTGLYGSLTSGGAASLGGILKADLQFGYTPALTDQFIPIQYPSFTGGFSSTILPQGASYLIGALATFTHTVIAAKSVAQPQVTIDATTASHTATTNLLGVNLAWWDSTMPTTQTQQMINAAGLTTYRFPGGSSSDEYHFTVAANFGDSVANTIPQFAQLIANVSGTGMLTIDYGSGSPQEGAAEFAYLLGSPSDTTSIGTGIQWNTTAGAWQNVDWKTVGYWASLRAASPLGANDGLNFLRVTHPAPYTQIKFWEVGNEEYGDWETDFHGTAGPGGVSTGAIHDPTTYANFAKQFKTYATEITTAAGLPAVSIGIDSGDPGDAFTRGVLTAGASIGFVPNYISDHSYMQGPGGESDQFLLDGTVSNPSSILDWSTRYNAYTTLLQQTLGSQSTGVQLMATEFNSVYTNPGKQSTSLVNGLFIADSIGSLLSSGYSAGYVWDLRNGYGTLGVNSSPSLYGWRTGGDYGLLGDGSSPPAHGAYIAYPNYFAEQLASKLLQAGGQVTQISSTNTQLHVYSVLGSDGHLRLMLINTNPVATMTPTINVAGFSPSGAATYWRYGMTEDIAQSQSATGAAALTSAAIPIANSTFQFDFPAYSMTVLDLTPNASVINGVGVNKSISLVQDADHQHIDWTLGAVTGQVLATATGGLTINGSNTINLSYAGGNPLPAALHLNGTLTINGLSGTNPLAGTTLEIGRSTVYFSYTPGNDPLSAMQSYLKNSYNSGAWTGTATATTGAITSAAAATNPAHQTAIGYLDSADGLLTGHANAIELKYTLYGDTGLTGSVGFTDFMRLTQHYTSTNAKWQAGDFNYDGTVDSADFALLQPVYGQNLASQPAAVPEAPIVTPGRPVIIAVAAPVPVLTDDSAGASKKQVKRPLLDFKSTKVVQAKSTTIAKSRKHAAR